ncbi:MAG: FG-GAP-like repeat-containing protein, partial [Thermoanaerobaculia bacterium]
MSLYTFRRAVSSAALQLVVLIVLVPDAAEASRRRPVHGRVPSLVPPVQNFVLRFFDRGLGQGEGDALVATSINGSLTLETWIRLDSITDAPRFVLLMNPNGAWVAGLSLTEQGQWLFFTQTGSVASESAATVGRWTHIAGRVNGTAIELLVDGAVAGASTLNTSVTIPQATLDLGTNVRGTMRQTRIWRAALSDTDVRRYAGEKPETTDSRLIAWWPLDDRETGGRRTTSVRDLGPLRITFAPPSFRARWVRPEVLESGPYFVLRPFEYASGSPQGSGLPFPRLIDFDQDGDLDVYSVHRMNSPCSAGGPPFFQGVPPQPDRIFRNDGTGRMVEASDEVLTGNRIQGFLVHATGVADFTGDGRTDIFVTENGPECGDTPELYAYPNSLRVGTSAGTLDNQSNARVPQILDVDHRSAFGDIDGDGDLDAVSATVEYDVVRFYVNDGSGVFSAETNRTAPARRTLTGVAMIDADLDGDLDLFGGDNLSEDGRNVLMLNDGAGRFAPAPESWLPAKE